VGLVALILAVLVLLSAGASLATSISTRRNLRRGAASYDDLVDFTGLHDRATLLRVPGVSEAPGGELTFDTACYDRLPKTPGARLLGTPLGDALCLLSVAVSLGLDLGGHALAWPPLLAATLYQGIGWFWAIRSLVRYRERSAEC
jgi:hypothetical protein